jgi:inosine-uridine nucleoside N-ribohydrolase
VDPTTRTLFKPDLIARIKAADTPVARYVGRHLEGFPMWDELAAAVWLEPAIVAHQETLLLGIDTNADGAGYGNTLSWPVSKGPGLGERPWTVVQAADVPALERLVEARLTAGAPR